MEGLGDKKSLGKGAEIEETRLVFLTHLSLQEEQKGRGILTINRVVQDFVNEVTPIKSCRQNHGCRLCMD